MLHCSVNTVSVYVTGSVCIHRENPESIFKMCASFLSRADIRCCNLEESISARRSYNLNEQSSSFCIPSEYVSGLTYAGFNVISLNGVHSRLHGTDTFIDTLNILKKNNIQVVGAGENVDEARKPVIIDRNDTRIAFLSYSSHSQPDFFAKKTKPGAIPLRIHTSIRQPVSFSGKDNKNYSGPDREDMIAMKDDIRKAKLFADVVIVLFNTGIAFVRAQLAEYQPEIYHSAIDAGADLILGYRSHLLKGIEVYKGKVIFYDLGDFVFEHHQSLTREVAEKLILKSDPKLGLRWHPDDPLLGHFPADVRKTLIAKIIINFKKIDTVAFIPVITNKLNQPEIMKSGSKGFNDVFQYIKDVTKEVGMNTQFRVVGDEIQIIVK